MAIKTEKEKLEYIKSAIRCYQEDTSNPNGLMALFLAHSNVIRGRDALRPDDLAKAMADVFGQQADIGESFELADKFWK